ncbi:hypothetical protein ACLNGM_09320 [Aureimonas phyllosphaerae]|uniref:hypothetical protein n=1 Tax=Aureimonas phyllosphaerae TaxID=1166078 RepID=UPI003A5C63B8
MPKPSKVHEIIGRAAVRSEALLQQPETGLGGERIARARWIMEIATQFLKQLPPREPTAPSLAEEGRIKFGKKFPKGRTIYNHYRGLRNVWQEAYEEIVSVSAIRTKGNAEPLNRTLEPGMLLDAGTVERLKVGEQRIRSLTGEVNRLREIIRKSVPAPPAGRPPPPEPEKAVRPMPELSGLREWLAGIERVSSGFEVDDIGLRATRLAGATPRIMPLEVIAMLRILAASDGGG